MHRRVLGLVLLAGCYLTASERDEYDRPRAAARAKRVAMADAGAHCPGAECRKPEPSAPEPAEDKPAQSIQARSVKADVPKKPETPTLGITISVPATKVDCGDVLLAVVGARPAVLGETVELTASWSGPVSDDESGDSSPTLLWADTDMMTNLTVTGPTTAEVLCDSLGVHEIRIELAPPAPCPATLQVEVECVEPKTI